MKFPLRIGVMADDLTGAGDVGGCFARAGFKTVISLPLGKGEMAPAARAAQIQRDADPAEIYVLDTESRYEATAVAEARVADAFWTLAALGANFFYKKIDSTLRGNVGPELDSFLAALLAWRSNWISEGNTPPPTSYWVPVIPAYPAAGRQTQEGWQIVNGVNSGIHIPTLLQRTCSSWPSFQVQDCAEPADLKRAALRLLRDFSKAGFAACVASGGLADPIAKAVGHPFRGTAVSEGAARRPTIIVCGSRHPSSLTQVQRFLDLSQKSVVLEGPGQTEVQWSDVASSLADSRRPPAIVVKAPEREGRSSEIGEWLARTTQRLLLTLGPSRLILMGGDTAFRVCDKLGVRKLAIQGMQVPGIAVCESASSQSTMTEEIVLKPGAFGPPSTLIQILKD